MVLPTVKKFIALLLCLTMVIAVMASCGSEDGGDNDTATTPADTTGDIIADTAGEDTTADADTDTDTDTEEVTDTETPQPDETTPKETEPPKEYEYTSVFKVDFTTMEDGEAPFSANNIDDLRIEGGLLKGTATNGDPHAVYTGEMALDASTVQEIHIKLMNYSSDFNFQFFFTTETVSWSEGASLKDYLLFSDIDGDDNDWNEIVLDPEESFDWEGTITSFRLDPFRDVTGDFEVEYVEFFTVTEK